MSEIDDFTSSMSGVAATYNFVERTQSRERSTRAATAQNASRPATVEITHFSTGLGQMRVKTALIFPVLFITEPHFTSGSAVVRNPNSKIWHDPVATSGVWAWKRDSRGYFSGAFIWVRAEVSPVDPANTATAPGMSVQHYLTFSAEAIKDLKSYKNAPSTTLTTRKAGIT